MQKDMAYSYPSKPRKNQNEIDINLDKIQMG